MTRTRLFMVHENSILAGQAARLLNNDPSLQVIDLLTSTHEALVSIGEETCDFVLVSASMPQNGALQLLKCLCQQSPGVQVIVTGLADDPKQILVYTAAGAAGYSVKKEGIGAWANQIHAVLQGKALDSLSATAALMHRQLATRVERQATLSTNLTSRECEILEMWAAGNSHKRIAEHLIMAVGTVKHYVQHVLKKLKLYSRKEVSLYLNFVQRRAYTSQIIYAQ